MPRRKGKAAKNYFALRGSPETCTQSSSHRACMSRDRFDSRDESPLKSHAARWPLSDETRPINTAKTVIIGSERWNPPPPSLSLPMDEISGFRGSSILEERVPEDHQRRVPDSAKMKNANVRTSFFISLSAKIHVRVLARAHSRIL